MLSNDTHITRILNFHPYFRETVILSNFIKFMAKNAVFCCLAQQELNVSYETSIFGQCSYCQNVDKNNYPEETELDTNPSLALARTVTLSTGERSFGHFTSSRCYVTKKSGEGSEIDLRRKITIAWNDA